MTYLVPFFSSLWNLCCVPTQNLDFLTVTYCGLLISYVSQVCVFPPLFGVENFTVYVSTTSLKFIIICDNDAIYYIRFC